MKGRTVLSGDWVLPFSFHKYFPYHIKKTCQGQSVYHYFAVNRCNLFLNINPFVVIICGISAASDSNILKSYSLREST